MKVYILKKSTNEIVSTYEKVDEVGNNYILCNNGTTRIYCSEDEYISLNPDFNTEKLKQNTIDNYTLELIEKGLI